MAGVVIMGFEKSGSRHEGDYGARDKRTEKYENVTRHKKGVGDLK